MIERWRQVVTATGESTGVAGEWFLAVGPFRGGGTITEIGVLLYTRTSGTCDWSLVVSAVGERSAMCFAAATPIFLRGDVRNVAGQPSTFQGLTRIPYSVLEFPVAIHVDGGARFVLLGLRVIEDAVAIAVCTVTVKGFAKMGANGLGVEDGLDQ